MHVPPTWNSLQIPSITRASAVLQLWGRLWSLMQSQTVPDLLKLQQNPRTSVAFCGDFHDSRDHTVK
eukprot:6382658-Amphidinium_carterae.1